MSLRPLEKGGKGKGKKGGRGGGRGFGYGISTSELGTIASAILHMRDQDLDQIESLIVARRHTLADIHGKAVDVSAVASDDKPQDGSGGKSAKKRKKSDKGKVWNNPLLIDVPYFKLIGEDTDKKFRVLAPAIHAMAIVGSYLVRAGGAKITEEAQKLDLLLACRLKDGETNPDPGMLRWLDALYRQIKITEESACELNNELITAAKTVEGIDALSSKVTLAVDPTVASKTLFVAPQWAPGIKRSREEAGITEEIYAEYVAKRVNAGSYSSVADMILD